MCITCKAILSVLYQCGIKINWKGFFPPYSFSGIIHRDIKVLLWVIFGGGFGDGSCLILFFALIMKNLYLYRIQLFCHKLLFFKSATSQIFHALTQRMMGLTVVQADCLLYCTQSREILAHVQKDRETKSL